MSKKTQTPNQPPDLAAALAEVARLRAALELVRDVPTTAQVHDVVLAAFAGG